MINNSTNRCNLSINLLGGNLLLPQTRALIAAMPTAPSAARQMLINRTIELLLGSGVWSNLDFFYIFAAEAQDQAILNWVAPGSLTLTNNNSTTFTTDRGFTGDGVSMSLSNAAYTPSKWTQNNGSVGAVGLTNGSNANSLTVRNGSAALRAQLRARNTTQSLAGVSSASSTAAVTGANTPNMVAGERNNDAANQTVYVNGVLDATGAAASLAFGGTPGEIAVLTNGTTFQTQQIAMSWGGASLGSTGQAAMYSAVKTYLAELGVSI